MLSLVLFGGLIALIACSTSAASPPPAQLASPSTQASTAPLFPRQPQWLLKDRRTLFSDEEITRARDNIAKYPAAKAVAEAILKDAKPWLAMDDKDLAFLIASSNVPRAFDVSAIGCPVCGNKIIETFGLYAWIIDPKQPFKIKCPVDGTVFPSNDFEAYYRSGFKEKVGWDTQYVDDGWGWTNPKNGEKYWFVAYANHYMILNKVKPAVLALGRAYLLTGDKRYAHKALVALYRFAEVYPSMDHAGQSRYGQMMRALGRDYPGKIVNLIWETDMMTALAEAYDACWDAIDGDEALQKFTGKTGEEIRAFIEANLLEDAIDAYDQGKIRGNYGMHQQTLALLAIVRQYGEQQKWLDSLMNDAGGNFQLLGLNYALYNLFFRDGVPFESSVHYNSIWLERISQYAPLLEKTGRRPFDIPKMRRMYDGALAMICARAHNPSMGDSGTIWGGIVRPDVSSYQIGYRHYRDPYCAAYLAHFDATGENGFKTFDSLFYPTIEPSKPETSLPAQPSRLLDGYGIGFLNNRNDSVALALYYGLKAGHGHFDRLNFEIFANGVPIMPDLGYPDAMNEFVPGIFTWSKNTIAHNTVTVDARRQDGNVAGTVELFANGSFARVIDVSTSGTYPQCEQYRRVMIMVDCGDDQAYFIDIFTVTGGKQHDYSLHGPPGTFEVIGGEWSQQSRGTLAGEDVAIGQIYDDPKLGAPGYKEGFGGYKGSGFQNLYNVRYHKSGEWIAQWSHEKDRSARLRIRMLEQPGQEQILAAARVSQMKFPQELTYLIARRQGENLTSRFISVIEPYKNDPLIRGARMVDATTISVQRTDGSTDTIVYSKSNVAVVRHDSAGQEIARFSVDQNSGYRGQVISVDPTNVSIRVRPDQPDAKANDFVGRVVQFRNELHRTSHTIISATPDGQDIVLRTSDDLLVGRARVDGVTNDALMTRTAMPLAAIYSGATLANANFTPLARVAQVHDGQIKLHALIENARQPRVGEDVWLINVGPGDEFHMPAIIDTSR